MRGESALLNVIINPKKHVEAHLLHTNSILRIDIPDMKAQTIMHSFLSVSKGLDIPMELSPNAVAIIKPRYNICID